MTGNRYKLSTACGEQDGSWIFMQKSPGGGNIKQEPVATSLKTPCETIPCLIN
jgi:hypothetical protein